MTTTNPGDPKAIAGEANRWLREHDARAERSPNATVYWAELALEDDERVARGEPSQVPIGARYHIEQRRRTREQIERVKNSKARMAAAQQVEINRAHTLRRAQELLSNPANVDALERLLRYECEAEVNERDLKVSA